MMKDSRGDEPDDRLAGDTPQEQLDSLLGHLGSWPVILKIYAFQIAASVAAFAYALAEAKPRIAVIGAGLLIRPLAHRFRLTSSSPRTVALVERVVKPLKVVFVLYCLYVAIDALG